MTAHPTHPAALDRWWRAGLAVVSGALTAGGFEPIGWWGLQVLGVAGLTLAVGAPAPRRGRPDGPRRRSTGFGLGYLFGVAMLGLSVGWIHVLGVGVAAALIAFMALWFGLLATALRQVRRLPGWPLWAAMCWVLMEFCYSRVPFGGFGWARLGYAAVDTPLAGLYPFVGVVGVSFASALIAQLAAGLAEGLFARRLAPRSAVAAGLTAGLLLGAGALGLGWSPAQPTAGSVTVGYVQGNVDGVAGIEAMGRARTVTANHLSETITLMAKARTGQIAMPDFVLWPENSTDIDPTLDLATHRSVQQAALLAGRSIFVGAVMEGPGPDERQTTGLWWNPQTGVEARYDKRNLVPFGEFIPFRDVLLPVLPILRLVGAQSVPGTAPGMLEVHLGDGRPLALGDIICFELAYDRTVYDTVTHGAQTLVVQSNNATYGGTAQIDQQFAITRVRAMETRRDITVATTDAVSGAVTAQGRVEQLTVRDANGSGSVTVPLQSAVTPAVRLAPWLDRALAVAALLAVAVGSVRGRVEG